MASTAQSQLRSIYRSFLRELPPISSSSTATTHLHRRLRQSFSPTPSTPPSREKFLQAEQYLHYLRAQRNYLTLLERYNPGLAMDASLDPQEDRERVEATARRVGMQLPELWGETRGGGEGGER
ncbi:MAG: hypothetical protein M1816_006282 [Peltula sp. TS41687]|nr:MAG: hypothetical protein M1816_006282 [Peltula sp. TS41687]